jgi:hypothetical protein
MDEMSFSECLCISTTHAHAEFQPAMNNDIMSNKVEQSIDADADANPKEGSESINTQNDGDD